MEWAFMTTHSWGETAAGLWTLEVDNDGWDDAEHVKWDLVLHGTTDETGPIGGSHPSTLMARSISRHADDGSPASPLPVLLAFIIPYLIFFSSL